MKVMMVMMMMVVVVMAAVAVVAIHADLGRLQVELVRNLMCQWVLPPGRKRSCGTHRAQRQQRACGPLLHKPAVPQVHSQVLAHTKSTHTPYKLVLDVAAQGTVTPYPQPRGIPRRNW